MLSISTHNLSAFGCIWVHFKHICSNASKCIHSIQLYTHLTIWAIAAMLLYGSAFHFVISGVSSHANAQLLYFYFLSFILIQNMPKGSSVPLYFRPYMHIYIYNNIVYNIIILYS